MGSGGGRLVAKAVWFGTTEQSPPITVGALGKRAGRAGSEEPACQVRSSWLV